MLARRQNGQYIHQHGGKDAKRGISTAGVEARPCTGP